MLLSVPPGRYDVIVHACAIDPSNNIAANFVPLATVISSGTACRVVKKEMGSFVFCAILYSGPKIAASSNFVNNKWVGERISYRATISSNVGLFVWTGRHVVTSFIGRVLDRGLVEIME